MAPLVTIDPYMNLLRQIAAGNKSSEPNHQLTTGQSMESVITVEGEKGIKRKIGRFGRLFGQAIPVVHYISDDRLIVSDGLLDACIAKFRKQEWLPVRMAQDAAKSWNSRSTAELDEVCKAQGRGQIYTPVMHPAYRNYRYSRRGQARLDMMRRYLGPQTAGMSLLDVGCNSGYYVFHFRRQGMDVTGIDMDREHLDVARAQVPMYGLNVDLRNVALQDLAVSQPYDVVLALSVLWHILGWGKMPAAMSEKELAEKLEQIVGQCLFWESGPDPQREIDLIRGNTGLTEFELLGRTSATGIEQRQFGVFKRSPR